MSTPVTATARSLAPRLTPKQYWAILCALMEGVQKAIQPPVALCEDAPRLTLDWPTTPAGHRLRLVGYAGRSNGAFLGLYTGDGDVTRGGGIVVSWSIYQSNVPEDVNALHVGSIHPMWMDAPGEPAHHPLYLDYSVAAGLTSNNPDAPPITADIIAQVEYWRNNLPPAPAASTI